jgi:hypothetical protein
VFIEYSKLDGRIVLRCTCGACEVMSPEQEDEVHLYRRHALPHSLSPQCAVSIAAFEAVEDLYKSIPTGMILVHYPNDLQPMLLRDSKASRKRS